MPVPAYVTVHYIRWDAGGGFMFKWVKKLCLETSESVYRYTCSSSTTYSVLQVELLLVVITIT